MAFRMIRQRREQRRMAKLEEIFQDRDKTQSGKISLDQLHDIFRIYQVEVNEAAASKIQDDNGDIAKDEFIKFAQDNKLLDFGNAMGGDALLGLGGGALGNNNGVSKRRQSLHPQSQVLRKPSSVRRQRKASRRGSESNLLCCFKAGNNDSFEDGDAFKDLESDRVAIAFSKFDLDNDGYLSWEEFRELGMEFDMATRIFRFCDKKNRGKITLEDFRRAADYYKARSIHIES